MSCPSFRRLRRCRLLFVLALCAWLGLAGSAFAQADCCAGMGGGAGTAGMLHHAGAPAPLHADAGHAACACLAVVADLAALPNAVAVVPALAPAWPAIRSSAPGQLAVPPLRPPLG